MIRHISLFIYFNFFLKKHDTKFIYRWGEGGKEEKEGKKRYKKKKTQEFTEREKNWIGRDEICKL